jgi:transcriptional regulator NrdR family protein
MPAVIKKDGRREGYFRQKILDGIQKACQKRSVPIQRIEELVGQIERRVQSYGLKEVPSKTLGQMVMHELHKLDKVAYIRFASVYREFRDVEEFVAELQGPPETATDDPQMMSFPFIAGAGEPSSETGVTETPPSNSSKTAPLPSRGLS